RRLSTPSTALLARLSRAVTDATQRRQTKRRAPWTPTLATHHTGLREKWKSRTLRKCCLQPCCSVSPMRNAVCSRSASTVNAAPSRNSFGCCCEACRRPPRSLLPLRMRRLVVFVGLVVRDFYAIVIYEVDIQR